ncbi:MAG: serine/threonine-protein kinase, partial [Planctomycetota bacterium]
MTPVTDTADASQPSVDRSAVTRAAIDAALSSQGETDRRLVAVLDEYVASLEAGTAEPIAAVAARHPELSPDLAECLEGVAAIHRAVDAARSPAGVAPDEAVTVDGPAADRATSGTSPPAPRELGDYRLLREIGRGGMGVVYEAEQRALRRRVALKVLPFAAVLDQRQIARFRNEAQAAAGLNHPHIVPVYAIGNERGVHYYAMQHIEGQSLGEAIAELRGADGASPSETAALGSEGAASFGPSNRTPGFFRSVARLGADAADALAHAHELGVVHRDIKPSNLLLDQQGKVWVTDFGLARMQTDLGVTATGDVVGTLRYMSPEQASGRADRVDGRTDVYALGATLYELLTLQHAHRGDNRARLLERLQRDDPIAPRRLNPALPADLENIVLRAMEKDRDARYASAAEMAEDLHRFLDGRPTVARPPTLAQHAAKWTRRHRRLVTIAAIALAAVTLVTAVSGVFLERARQQTQAALVAAEGHRDRTERLLEQARTLL